MNYHIKTSHLASITLLALSFLFVSFAPPKAKAQGTVTVIVENIKNTKGSIAVGLYSDQASFSKDKPLKYIVVSKKDCKNNQLSFKVDLPKGTYGMALLDDENDNRKMDYSFAFPKEGYGFSNYYHKGWSKPTFSKFGFYHNGQASTVKIKVQYI